MEECCRKTILYFLATVFILSEVTTIAVGDNPLEHRGKSVLTASSV